MLACHPDHWAGPGYLPFHCQAGHQGARAGSTSQQAGQEAENMGIPRIYTT